MSTINRRKLMNDIAKGLYEAKCDYSMTDDYAFDNANNFGRMTEWKSARIKAASVWEEVTLQNGNIGLSGGLFEPFSGEKGLIIKLYSFVLMDPSLMLTK